MIAMDSRHDCRSIREYFTINHLALSINRSRHPLFLHALRHLLREGTRVEVIILSRRNGEPAARLNVAEAGVVYCLVFDNLRIPDWVGNPQG
jgi:hypothetical protein